MVLVVVVLMVLFGGVVVGSSSSGGSRAGDINRQIMNTPEEINAKNGKRKKERK